MQKRLDIEGLLDHIQPSEFDSIARQFHSMEIRRWREHLPDPATIPWISTALYTVLAAAIFLYGAWYPPSFGFDSDDLMNLHEGYTAPPLVLLRALVVPFTSLNRPIGEVYYRLCFDLFGWNPAAFRTVTYSLMLVNIALLWLVARRLTGSMEMGAAAALLYSFHGRLRGMYQSNGTVYDVLCALFLLLTLWYYLRVDQERRPWAWWRVGILLVLYICALNAKEMAAIPPVLLLVFRVRNLRDPRMYVLPAALGLLTLLALWGKTQAGGPFHGAIEYTASFTLKRFFQNARGLHSELFYLGPRQLSTRQVLALWAALVILPFGLGRQYRPALWFSAAFAILGPFPIAFLPPRDFYVMYVPLIGWAIYFGILAVIGRNWITSELRRRRPMDNRQWIAAQALLAIFLSYLVTRGLNDPVYASRHFDPMGKIIAETKTDFANLRESVRPNSRLLLLHSRFPDDAWGPLMIARLHYHDPDLWLDRPTMLNAAAPPDPATYDLVLDFDGTRLFVVRRKPS